MRRTFYGLALCLVGQSILQGTVWASDERTNASIADPALRQFVLSIVDNNPRVQASRAALEASSAFRDAASRPLYNPALSLDAENAETDTRSIGISQTLDWSGKRKARTAVAESDRLVVEAEYLAARWGVTVELLNGLAQHQTGQARHELAESRQQLMNQFLALAQRRFDAGDLNQVELDLARLSATDARIQQATAGAALAEARQAVRSLSVQAPVNRWPLLPATAPILPTSADPQRLVLALPEVLAARREVQSADALVELRRREKRPDPTLSLAGGEENGESLIGLNVTIPLFVRNRFNYEVTAAMAERSQAQQIADDILQRAHARLTSAIERYDLSHRAWGDWEMTGQTSLSRQTEQLQRLWQAGELSTTDYLVQLNATLDVQASALDLRDALWRAWFEWLWASGQVDAWLGQGVR